MVPEKSPLVPRIEAYLAGCAPHVKERMGTQLLIEALETIITMGKLLNQGLTIVDRVRAERDAAITAIKEEERGVEIIIGPQSCQFCGGEYGLHASDCCRPKAV